MKNATAISALSALAQEHRLQVFRMLEATQIPDSSATGAQAGQGRQPPACDRFIAAKPERPAGGWKFQIVSMAPCATEVLDVTSQERGSDCRQNAPSW